MIVDELKRVSKVTHIESLILLTYHQIAPDWLAQCTLEQLAILFEGIVEKHWEYHQLNQCLLSKE